MIIDTNKLNIVSLDDIAGLFFTIAREVGHPLKNINLELHKTFAERSKLNAQKVKRK